MNLLYYHNKTAGETGIKEIMFSVLSIFAVTFVLSTKSGAHVRCLLSVWKAEFGFDIHNWSTNIVRFKESEDLA